MERLLVNIYLLNTLIRKHADRYVESDPEFVKQIKTGFYVDDLAISVTDARDGIIDFYTKCKVRFAEASFNVRKWRTNDPELKGILAEKEIKFDTSNHKVLGVHWDDIRDTLIINFDDFVTETFLENVTKRQMLRLVASFYDPLGLIQFVVVSLKILFQEACKLKADWDDPVLSELEEKWRRTINEIKGLGRLVVPRCYCYRDIPNPIVHLEMHGFSDASLSAYGACVYLKFVKRNGDIVVNLVASKSRIAPLKNQQTIPRLELMGNLILCRLLSSILCCFIEELEFSRVMCYTELQICLAWIRATQREFKNFVQNRLLEIRGIVTPDK